jgi:hypothetical protein
MRNVSNLFLALALVGCAPGPKGPRPINVQAVRHELEHVVEDGRPIVAMGQVTETSAVIYTERDGQRTEELWVRTDRGWKLDHSLAVTRAAKPPT